MEPTLAQAPRESSRERSQGEGPLPGATPAPSPSSERPAPAKRCLAIVPALNEERQIGPVVDEIRASAPDFDVLVIDDGSTDHTAEIARAHGATVVRHPFNMGYGVALQTAYKYAARNAYDVLVQLDGDGQHDPSFIPRLADRVIKGEIDVCVGTRFKEGLGYIPPFLRRVGMVVFGFIASVATRRRVTDPTSGYQALTRRAFSFCQTDVFPFDYPDADVLILLHRAGFKVDEEPVRMKPSPTGKSMHGGVVKPLFYVFKMFLSITVTLLREKPRADRVAPGEKR
ncbi:glycosyltransferase family 2 protein [bacterium]|nr:glycosyltransferase family 2 protein [bacterium]